MRDRPAWGEEVSPEIELLLRAARPGTEPGNDARIGELMRGGPAHKERADQCTKRGHLLG